MFRVPLNRAARANAVLLAGGSSIATGAGFAAGVGAGLIVGGLLAVVYGAAVMDHDEPAGRED